jgi:hypothetical protein
VYLSRALTVSATHGQKMMSPPSHSLLSPNLALTTYHSLSMSKSPQRRQRPWLPLPKEHVITQHHLLPFTLDSVLLLFFFLTMTLLTYLGFISPGFKNPVYKFLTFLNRFVCKTEIILLIPEKIFWIECHTRLKDNIFTKSFSLFQEMLDLQSQKYKNFFLLEILFFPF